MAAAALCHVSPAASLEGVLHHRSLPRGYAYSTPRVSNLFSSCGLRGRMVAARAPGKEALLFGGGGEGGGGRGRRGGGRGGGGRGGGGRPWGSGGDSHGGDGSSKGEGYGGRSFSLWERYLALLESSPLSTKALTSMLINMLGDLFCQVAVEERSTPDRKRLGISALLGLLLVGPTLHFWYSSLGRIVTVGGNAGAAGQLILDQFVFSPTFICVFFAALLTLEGRPQEILPKLKQDWGTTVVTNWKIWIPFQFLNFRLVPPPLRVGAANIIALAWNVYLSFASHTKLKTSQVPS